MSLEYPKANLFGIIAKIGWAIYERDELLLFLFFA